MLEHRLRRRPALERAADSRVHDRRQLFASLTLDRGRLQPAGAQAHGGP